MELTKSLFGRIKSAFGVIAVALGMITALFVAYTGIQSFIDSRIEEKIADEAFVRKVAQDLRPFVLFDNNGSILFDQGAMKYIDHIKIDSTTQGDGFFITKIVVSPNRFLETPPLLQSIDITEHIYEPQRGEKFDIIYHCINPNVSGIPHIRFRLEILR